MEFPCVIFTKSDNFEHPEAWKMSGKPYYVSYLGKKHDKTSFFTGY